MHAHFADQGGGVGLNQGKPGVEALLLGHQVERQAVAHGGVEQAGRAAFREHRQIGHDDGRQVHGVTGQGAMEIAAAEAVELTVLAFEEHGIVGGGVETAGQHRFHIGQRVAYGAVNLRTRAKADRILHARAGAEELVA